MRRALVGAGGLALVAALWVGCGGDCRVILSGGLVLGCGDEPPGPGDPAFGSAAEVLVTDCDGGQLLWVGMAAAPTPTPTPSGGAAQEDAFAALEALRCEGKLHWIGGTVRVADDHPNGFYFDPNTILVLETAAPAMQTTIGAIARDPQLFTPAGEGGQPAWVVPAAILAIETPLTLLCPLAPACSA